MRARRWASARERPERMRSSARLAMWERSSSSMSRSRRERRKNVELMKRRELRSFIGHPRYRCKNTGAESRRSAKARFCATKANAGPATAGKPARAGKLESDSAKYKFSFIAQGDHGIDFHGTTRGDVAGEERDEAQKNC